MTDVPSLGRRPAVPDLQPIVFLDTETLGLDAEVHAVWEVGLIAPVAACCVVHDTLVAAGFPFTNDTCDGTWHYMSWQQRVSDREIALAHPEGLRVSGFQERYNRDAAASRYVSLRALADLTAGQMHLVGACTSFDEERLRRAMWAEGFAPDWHYHLLEVENLAAGYVMGRYGVSDDAERQALTLPWHSEDLSRSVGVEPTMFGRHTALGDARWAKAIWEAVMDR